VNAADQAAGITPSQQTINNLQMPRYKEIQLKGKTVKLKYCFTVTNAHYDL
jgi:hypothetical protein